MADSAAAWCRGIGPARPSSRSRTQGEANTRGTGEPEDDDPAPIIRIHPARGVVESTI
jgi:hypothetical protein